MEGLWCGRFVEVEVAAEYFVRTFTTKYHLDAHALDDTRQQVHGRGCADSGYVVGFDEVDDIANGVQPFLNGVVYFMVDSADVLRHFTCFDEVGSTFQAYCKRVELRPPRICLVVRLNTFSGVFLGDGRDYGRVQPAGQQHAVRYVRHKLALYDGFEGIMYGRNLSLVGCGIDVRVTSMIVVFYGKVLHPVASVPAVHFTLTSPVIVSGQERLVLVAEAFESFQFAAEVDAAFLVAAYI